MKLDLHLHTSERSPCACHPIDQVLGAALEHGLGGVAITDHDRFLPASELRDLCRKYAPLRLFNGIEVTLGDEHVLVHGVRHPKLERRRLDYPELWRLVRGEGGFLTVAHPFRYRDTIALDLEKYPPDAFEIHSFNTARVHGARIRQLAREFGLRTLATSDAHDARNVGIYHLVLEHPVETDAELVAALRRGAFRPGCRAARLQAVNAEVELRETMIRQMISAGRDRRHFRRMTGQWEGFFDFVEHGKSHVI
jgi:predicted metal-dependent phosphoesterase TrpH